MYTLAEVKNALMLRILDVISLVNKVQLYLGWISVKNSVVAPFEYKGLPCTSVIHDAGRIKNIEEYDGFRPDDLVIVTYAKAGTHFTADIVGSIYNLKGLIKTKGIQFVPVEICPAIVRLVKDNGPSMKVFDDEKSPRLFVTHLPWSFLPKAVKDGKVKMIHCARNPKDVACSGFAFFKKMKMLDDSTTWEDWLNLYVSNEMIGYHYFDYLKEWYPHRNMSCMLNLYFEDMKRDLDGSVRKIAKHLGLQLTDEEVEKVVTANTFANKKKEEGRNSVMYRTGKSGGWKADFSVEQNEMFDAWIEEHMKDMPDLKLDYQ